MTINELIKNKEVNKDSFQLFTDALESLKKELGCEINLIILSGTSQNSAMQAFLTLNNVFKESQSNVFKGFAYEYGGFFIRPNGTIKKYYNNPTSLNNINELCKKYRLSQYQGCKLYYSFKFKQVDEQALNFVDECKETFKDKDFEFFNDEYGSGLDIKNRDLNKHEFVSKYLKNKKIDILIFGGDSAQDEIMFEKSNFQNKYFLGFKEFTSMKDNYFLSSQKNIWGIIDDLRALTMRLKNNKIFESEI